MRLRNRFVLLIGLASLLPLGILGFVAVSVSSTRLVAKVAELQARSADAVAEQLGSWLALQQELLARQASSFDFGQMQDDERAAFLRLVLHQSGSARAVAMLDGAGLDLAPALQREESNGGSLDDAGAVVAADLRAEARALLRGPRAGALRLGRPRALSGGEGFGLVMVARQSGGAALAVDLDLGPLLRRLQAWESSQQRICLLDEEGRVLLGDGSLLDPAAVGALPSGVSAYDVRYRLADGEQVLAAVAPVPGTAWMVLVAEPMAATSAPVQAIAARTLYVALVAGLLSVVLGVVIGRQVTGPLSALREAALAVAEGQVGRRVEGMTGTGELAELSRVFNFMSRRLQQDREVIAAKNAEIEAFNRDLQARVEERTRQLTEAQERLVRSARMAAVGEMGAGLAHELNNPLASVLGLAQVLGVKAQAGRPFGEGEQALLGELEQQARRCARIVERMQRLSRMEASPGPMDRQGWRVVDLGQVLREVVELLASSFRERGGELLGYEGPELPVLVDTGALAQALTELLASMRTAVGPGAALRIEGRIDEGQAVVSFRMEGQDLKVGQDDWMAASMAFWVARQVFVAHGGAFEEPSLEPGRSVSHARWRLRLPVA